MKEQIRAALRAAGIEGEINLLPPPKPELGDWAYACFEIARVSGRDPVAAAQELAKNIRCQGAIASVKAAGPYVNFFLKTDALMETVINAIQTEGKRYGFLSSVRGDKILIEYPSNNTHKELHVGHLRNICIGNSLAQLFLAAGFKVIPVNYLNDFGAHVAKCLWGIRRFHAEEHPPRGEEQRWLGQIYAEASLYLEKHPEEKIQVDELQKKLEARDRDIWKLYIATRAWSITGFSRIFKELSVKHKKIFYESSVKSLGQTIVDKLLEQGIATRGDGGAIIMDLSKYGLDIALLRKSNGAGLYLTSDLGLAVAKNKQYPAAVESIHITSSEQVFYFKQLFKVLAAAGYNYKMTHIPYGLVTLASGKMSSRSGNVLLYEDVRDEVLNKVIAETKNRHPEWSKKKVMRTARIIAFAAIKFDFLKHEAEKSIAFDVATAISFDGFTGPYVLYTVARINSIKRKASRLRSRIDFTLLSAPEEKQLALQLAKMRGVVEKAFAHYNPSVMVKYAFDLAKSYNDFYNKHTVLNASDRSLREARLALSLATRQVLVNALHLLTIGTVEEM